MYKNFFGLKESPFGLTPNTALYYGLPPHEEALLVLKTALENGEGFIKITGEVGTGKTMVLRLFIGSLPKDYELVYIPNPVLDPIELKFSIARELAIDTSNSNNISILDEINQKLLDLSKNGKKVVLVIDEAQGLMDETLETIRLLGNLETERSKLLQIVLFGQPELDEKLSKKEFRQLRQRISFSYSLRPLNFNETRAYLNYRMTAAGYKGKELFSSSVSKTIFKSSYGIPRIINILAHKCLVLAYGYGVYNISNKIVKDAIKDTEAASQQSTNISNVILIFAIVVLVALIVALLYY